jgi:hypothetical protein
MPEHKGWGGKREGAGRKPIGPAPMVQVTVTLPPDVVARLRRLGGGNLSRGIRRVAERVALD